jgi:hypothetical protein
MMIIVIVHHNDGFAHLEEHIVQPEGTLVHTHPTVTQLAAEQDAWQLSLTAAATSVHTGD